MSQDWSTPNRSSLYLCSFHHLHSHHPLPVPPLLVQGVGGHQSQQQVEDGHDCTKLCCVATCPCWIVDSEDDDVQEDAEDVDGQTEKDRIFTLWESNTPHKAAEEHQVMDEGGLQGQNYEITEEDAVEIPGYPTLLVLPRILVKGVQEKMLSVSALGHLATLVLFPDTPC